MPFHSNTRDSELQTQKAGIYSRDEWRRLALYTSSRKVCIGLAALLSTSIGVVNQSGSVPGARASAISNATIHITCPHRSATVAMPEAEIDHDSVAHRDGDAATTIVVDAGAAHTACVLTLLALAPVAAQSAYIKVRMVAGARLWKRFGPLHVHTPEVEYILALKITAGHKKRPEGLCYTTNKL